MTSFLLDTNVVSELMRAAPSPIVLQWVKRYADAEFFSCAITKAEVLVGIRLLPEGQRKRELMQDAELTFQEDFTGQCLPFDLDDADIYAQLVAAKRQIGKPISIPDAQIAAIALHHNLALVTRNTKDFEHIANLALINPWLTELA
jgi:toxin FitB